MNRAEFFARLALVTATRFLVEAAKEVKTRIIYISTDFIFDGEAGPYKEDDEPKPLNYYGSTKLSAETEIIESGLEWSIIRTVLVIGTAVGTRSNIISWVRDKLTKGEKIKVVDDQFRTPTFTEDLAKGILLVVESGKGHAARVEPEERLDPARVGEAPDTRAIGIQHGQHRRPIRWGQKP